MAPKSKIAIPKPCKENWLDMNPVEKARFCNLCQKNVFDFDENNTETSEIKCLRYPNHLEEDDSKLTTIVNKIGNYIIKKK
jgi:hypothetical protein